MFVLFPMSVFATNRYISTTGSDATGDGTSGNRWRTLSYAISASSAGDTILIADVTYSTETTQRAFPGSLTIMGENSDYTTAIIDYATSCPSASHYIASAGRTITYKYLTFKFGTSNGGSLTLSGGTTVDNCIVNAYYCFFTASGTKANPPYGVFYNNRSLSTGWTFNLYKCTFRNVINAVVTLGGGTINTKDCIYYGCGDVFNSETTTNTSYNCYNGNTTDPTLGTGDISTDPSFTGAGVATLNNPTSGCIDTGVTVGGIVDTYLGTAPDMGSDEVAKLPSTCGLFNKNRHSFGTDF